MTGYETLQQAVADAQNVLNDARTALTALQQDGTYIRLKGILADPRVVADPNGWIDGSGVFWNSADAPAARANGQRIVTEHEGRIAAQQTVVTDAKATLDSARKALTDYEKNSPIGQQAAASLKDAQSKNTLVVTVVVIGIVVVVVAVAIWFVRKKKKTTTPTT